MSTSLNVLAKQHQESTVTQPNRHLLLVNKCFKEGILKSSPQFLLSYGCSSGDEVAMLCEQFPNAKLIVGVDIDVKRLAEARARFASSERVLIMSSLEFTGPAGFKPAFFDFITCFNMLCNHGGPNPKPMPFVDFQHFIQNLVLYLQPEGGVLCTYGTNYRVCDVSLSSDFILKPIKIDSGPVLIYHPDEVTIHPRDSKNVFAVVRSLLNNSNHEQKVIAKDTTFVNGTTTTPLASQTTSLSPKNSTQSKLSQSVFAVMQNGTTDSIPVINPTVRFGIMRPGVKSNNIGDYIQTLAQLNVLSVFYNRNKWKCTPSLHRVLTKFASCKPSGECVHQKNYPCSVELEWVDRDATQKTTTGSETTESEKELHLIANGWYMHRGEDGKFAFPFAPHIRPIFVSVHIAQPELLDSVDAQDYFRKHEPIGCRDEFTQQLFEKFGIKAYFSSCLTTTLELPVDTTLDDESLDSCKKCVSSTTFEHHHQSATHQEDCLDVDVLESNFSHHFPDLLKNATQDEVIELAMDILVSYSRKQRVRSTRIHCLLPARAVNSRAELGFSSKNGGLDGSWMKRSRFSGLTTMMMDSTRRELLAMVAFENLVERVSNILFNNTTSKQHKSSSTGVGVVDVTSYQKQVLDARTLRLHHPSSIICRNDSVIANVLNTAFNVRKKSSRENPLASCYQMRKCPFDAFRAKLDIFVTFDDNYFDVFQTFLKHIAASNSTVLLRIWCATRNVSQQLFLSIKKKPHNIALFQIPLDEGITFSNYSSVLTHVSNVCLDRLLLERFDFGAHDVDRVIYIDLDICVNGSLLPLLDLDSGPRGLIAKSSQVPNVVNSWLAKYDNEGAKRLHYPFGKSFNAGVIVFDISKIKKHALADFCLDLYSKTGINDQMLLNFYAQGEYKELPGHFNIFVGQDDTKYAPFGGLPNSAVMYHFVGSQKPWLFQSANLYPHNPHLWQLWNRFDIAKKLKRAHLPG